MIYAFKIVEIPQDDSSTLLNFTKVLSVSFMPRFNISDF